MNSSKYTHLHYCLLLAAVGFCLFFTTGFTRQKEYCSLFTQCKINTKTLPCPDSLTKGIEDVIYDNERCEEARTLVKKKIDATDYLGQKMYGFLGQQYRVEYIIQDSLPISIPRFEYLINDIPLAAKVVNAFQKTKYKAEYLDGDQKKYWRGDNGSNLTGEANLVSGSTEENELIYFGFGIVSILKWKLKGQVLFQFKYKEVKGKAIPYELKVLVFPGGAVVNAIMNMGMFKSVVRSKILEVFEHITDSAKQMKNMKQSDVLKKYKWTEEEKKKLQVLLKL